MTTEEQKVASVEPEDTSDPSARSSEGKRSVIGVVIHSFFLIPFLIAVISVFVFVFIQLLVKEEHTVYDHLNDIKVGGATKRWQAAFELSKVLSEPPAAVQDPRFVAELNGVYDHAQHDDVRVRQYLALAMGRSGNRSFVLTLIRALEQAREAERPSILLALGLLKDSRALPTLRAYLGDPDPLIRNRSAMALGFLPDPSSIEPLKAALRDQEPNVRWNAAIALAKLGDRSGNEILAQLLSRDYLSSFPEVDAMEQDQALLVAIEGAALLNDSDLNNLIRSLSEEDKSLKIREAAVRALK